MHCRLESPLDVAEKLNRVLCDQIVGGRLVRYREVGKLGFYVGEAANRAVLPIGERLKLE
jgi:hypothetical protein